MFYQTLQPDWTSFETAENDFLDIKEKGLVTVKKIAEWRAFFEGRKRDFRNGSTSVNA